jgi:hypothetical protein
MKVDVIAQPARHTQQKTPSGDLLAVPRDGGAPLDPLIGALSSAPSWIEVQRGCNVG